MTVQVAHGYATILPDLDFETYSEAGYIWVEGKLQSTLGKGKKGGLPAVGSLLYSLHPSTEVLCMAYDLKDGLGKRLWHPALPAPLDLFNHVTSKGIVESWNTTFEHHIWNNVCVPKYGFPPLHYTQQRDAMAKARAFSLPAKLGKAAQVLGTLEQKDKEGTRLLNKFSKPRNPTAKDPSTRILPLPSDPDTQLLYDYCIQDIATEEDISSHIPDLSADELEFWLNTCKSNYAGVGIRHAEVEACISILEQAYTKYNLELANITNGEVMEYSKVEQLRQWCISQGVNTPTLDDDATKRLLGLEIPLNVRRALEIRQMVGSAGVKKVYTMKKIASPEGRLCDLFVYHGARTGRDTGAEVQPQNLTKAGVKVTWCGVCDKPFGNHWKDHCPHCNAALPLFSYVKDDGKWTWEAVDHAIEAIMTRSLDYVEWIFGNAVLTVSGCIRGLFVASEGKEFICSDYSAIEAVVLAALAGEQWRLDTFHAKEDIYLKSASTITGTTMQQYKEYAKETGSKHPDRQKIGKVAELACFGADTLILTDTGWKRIVDITTVDKLFDGIDFVSHSGIVSRGNRKVTTLLGVDVTWEHKFYLGGEKWKTTEDLKGNTPYLKQAMFLANSMCLGLKEKMVGALFTVNAPVGELPKQSLLTLDWVGQLDAIPVLRKKATKLKLFGLSTLAVKCQLQSSIKSMRITLHKVTRLLINSKVGLLLNKLFLSRSIEVFDVMDCGARNRFVVLTEGGVIIAHNSGYAGWIGAWKNFGADKFFSDDEIKKLIVAWRDASPSIPEFWGGQVRGFPWNPTRFEYYGLEGAMVQAIMNPNQCFMTHGISFGMRDDAVFVRLPSGRILTYHRPRLTPNPKYEGQFEISYEGWNSNALMGAVGWFRMSTYGGKLCENIVQAVSRDIMAYAVNNLERAGYDVVIRVHDEIVAEIEEGSGNIEEFERIMATLPPWATGMPVRASGGWIGKRYRKD